MRKRHREMGCVLVIQAVVLIALLGGVPVANALEEMSKPIEDNPVVYLLLFDQLEYKTGEGRGAFAWNVQGWIGTDYNRFWVKTEGERELSVNEDGNAEFQLLYSRLISPYFDFQAGVRHDELYGSGPHRQRSFGVIGIQGLGLYWFELEFALFASEDGDVSTRLTGEYDLLITQRLVLQPRLETEVAVQEVEEFGVGEGFNYVELGARLRYEIRRELAPYIGVSWLRKVGETADIARRKGEEADDLSFVLGLRLWF